MPREKYAVASLRIFDTNYIKHSIQIQRHHTYLQHITQLAGDRPFSLCQLKLPEVVLPLRCDVLDGPPILDRKTQHIIRRIPPGYHVTRVLLSFYCYLTHYHR